MEAHIEVAQGVSRVSFSETPPPFIQSQLSVWGFKGSEKAYTSSLSVIEVAPKIDKYLTKKGYSVSKNEYAEQIIVQRDNNTLKLTESFQNGKAFKEAGILPESSEEFLEYIKGLGRKLKDHQVKAAIHYISVGNGANFSVPGSGKTTVALAIWGYLKSKGKCGPIAVIGPSSSFGPWQKEFRKVFLEEPDVMLLGGTSSDLRRDEYNRPEEPDLILTNFQTIYKDVSDYKTYLENTDKPVFLIVDEAHYIKQIGGVWAQAIMSLASLTDFRYILSGTPFPRSHADAFNLFEFLWPHSPPICEETKHRIIELESKKRFEEASEYLKSRISPLFYRVRKKDLNLSEQDFQDPLLLEMNPEEQLIYDKIVGRIKDLDEDEFFQDLETVEKLRKGRIMRLRQAASYPPLLMTALEGYEEDTIGIVGDSLAEKIINYDKIETPKKMERLLKEVKELTQSGEKVVVWGNFILCLQKIQSLLEANGIKTRLITGATPVAKPNQQSEETREKYIEDFLHGDVMVLIGNPAACAESISLHTHCSTAIYYDMSFNCAQFLQSLDRIHRVGGSEEKISHYKFLQNKDTVEQNIWGNISRKKAMLEQLLDDDCPVINIDFEEEDSGELAAYDEIFRQH